VTRAYRGAVFGGGLGSTEGLRSRVARGRPNWWVILAVSLGLIALLVATAGSTPPVRQSGGSAADAASRVSPGKRPHLGAGTARPATTTTAVTTTTTMTSPPSSGTTEVAASHLTTETSGGASTPQPAAPSVTTTTVAPATTTTTEATPAVPADRTQTQGYLNPPVQTSNKYGFAGTGAMQISVVWSGSTYLTMQVSCPSGDQSVGGTAAMAASLPDASGSCLATVSEPASETTSLTYTISIGPAGG
jgi:cytoskeletal protein RodZ